MYIDHKNIWKQNIIHTNNVYYFHLFRNVTEIKKSSFSIPKISFDFKIGS